MVPASAEAIRLGIISLMRLFKGQQLTEDEAISEAKMVIGVPLVGPSVAAQQSDSLPGPDPSFKHAMAFSLMKLILPEKRCKSYARPSSVWTLQRVPGRCKSPFGKPFAHKRWLKE